MRTINSRTKERRTTVFANVMTITAIVVLGYVIGRLF